jgi:tape measure domain-containing protein
MPLTADKVIVEFEAKLAKYNADIASSAKRFEQATSSQARQIQNLERQIKASSSSIGGTLKGLAAGFAGAFTAQQATGILDSFTRIQNALKVTGLEGTALKGVQDQLLAQSQQYGVDLESLARLYGNVSLAANDLGISQQQILGISEKTSQALKITGTSSVQAAGAILGLQQALSSSRISIEEFNQINEGGLRPLLQAAANSEQFGGSISKLRNFMKETGISGREFFQLIEDGSGFLGGTASKAALTLSGAFEGLTSSLIVYAGEADRSNGVSVALTAGLNTLAANIDLVANSIAVIAVAVGARYSAALILATRATVAKTIADAQARVVADALAASQLRGAAALNVNAAASTRAAVATGVLATAGRGLLGLLGGPLGLAITAVTLGLAYLATRSTEAEDAQANLARQLAIARGQIDETTKGVARFTSATSTMTEGVRIAGERFDVTRQKAFALGAQLGKTAAQALLLARATALANLEEARGNLSKTADKDFRSPFARFTGVEKGTTAVDKAERERARNEVVRARKNFEVVDQRIDREVKAGEQRLKKLGVDNPFIGNKDAPGSTGGVGGGLGKKTGAGASGRSDSGPSGPSGPSRAELDARAASEQRSLDIELLRAKLALAETVEKRTEINLAILDIERAERQAQLDANKELTDAQRKKQQTSIDALFGGNSIDKDTGEAVVTASFLKVGIKSEADKEQERKEQELLQAQFDATRAGLETTLANAKTREERFEIERALLLLNHNAQDAALDAQGLDADILAEKRKQLAAETELAKQQIERANESPLQAFRRKLNEDGANISDNIEGSFVSGIEGLSDGISDAIVNANSLGEAFSNVGDVFKATAKQIIADLIRIAVQQLIVKTLLDSIGGGGGGGGGGGEGEKLKFLSLLGLPGFNTGGSGVIGGRGGIDRNILSLNGNPFARVSKGETLSINNPSLSRPSTGGAMQQIIQVDARGAVMNDEFAAMILSQSRQFSIQASAQAVKAANAQAPGVVNRKQRFG